MSAHTPGPWKIDWYVCREKGKELWRVPRCIGPAYVDHNHWAGNHFPISAADARLIAAAPDLLAALQDLVAWHDADHNDSRAAIDNARAAIAKATEQA